ncbi:MAG: histone deacetylase [Desulfobulbaceae bacterium]|nr:histone deacetylase [Desulfobulbaceae bacterium]
MRRTAVYRDELFLEHKPGFGHVESPERLRVIYDELDKGEAGRHFVYPSFGPAPPDIISLNHSPRHVRRVAETRGQKHDYLDADTQTSSRSFEAACLAVGALIDGMNRIADKEFDNCFCLVRPPGHHAEYDRSMGFCLFNSIAVAARWALKNLGLERIFIMDWDLHHGNGTQHSFYDTDRIFYCSTHQYPHYPGTGSVIENGEGKGEGFTLNIPLPGGQGDLDYARIFRELIVPVARQYQPQFVLVSCGFDIYGGDPLGAMRVSPAGFAAMTRFMLSLAEEVCGGKLLITLEGGYNMTGMKEGGLAVLSELYGKDLHPSYPDFSPNRILADLADQKEVPLYLAQAQKLAKSYWKL